MVESRLGAGGNMQKILLDIFFHLCYRHAVYAERSYGSAVSLLAYQTLLIVSKGSILLWDESGFSESFF
jgi:hypothetical protein